MVDFLARDFSVAAIASLIKEFAAPDGMPSARAWSLSSVRRDFRVLSSILKGS